MAAKRARRRLAFNLAASRASINLMRIEPVMPGVESYEGRKRQCLRELARRFRLRMLPNGHAPKIPNGIGAVWAAKAARVRCMPP